MFFEQSRIQFFRPVTGKYREQVVACLSQLYMRLYRASQADFGESLRRDDVIEVFHEAIVRTPLLTDEEDDEQPRTNREQASWVLNTLIEHGWLEKHIDEVTMTSTLHFTRSGRSFTDPFLQSTQVHRTRHRNTRSTYNSLLAFVKDQEIYDLIDAWDHSERIISDFAEVITELEERRNLLVKDMESQLLVKKASEEFFDFMEKRFQPDLSVKLTADGVEKYRDRIVALLDQVRSYDRKHKAMLEKRVRLLLPDMVKDGQSLLYLLLDNIEQRIRATSEIIVPQLRRAIQGFTKRADVILRQLSYLSAQNHDNIIEKCRQISVLDRADQDRILLNAGHAMASCTAGFLDPAQVKIATERKTYIPSGLIEESNTVDETARHEIHVQSLLDQAFYVNNQAIQDYLLKNLAQGNSVDTADLSIQSAEDLLALSHIIEIGAYTGLSSEYRFHVEPVSEPVISSDYFEQRDRFIISLIEQE